MAQSGQAWVLTFSSLFLANSDVTMPVGTAIIPYPRIIMKEATIFPNIVIGVTVP